MMRNTVLLGLLAVALQIAGCAALRGFSGDQECQVAELVGYAQRFAALSADEQRREYNAVKQQIGKNKTACSRLRLALLLSTPGTGVRDDARAAALLEPLLTRSEPATALNPLAALLYAQISERAREHKRAEQLRDQLDALKEVERSLIERGPQSQPRRH